MSAPQDPYAPQVPLVLFDGVAHHAHWMEKMFEIQVEQLISGIWETFSQVTGGGGGGGRSQVNETEFGHVVASVIQVPFWRIANPVVPASEHQTQVNP